MQSGPDSKEPAETVSDDYLMVKKHSWIRIELKSVRANFSGIALALAPTSCMADFVMLGACAAWECSKGRYKTRDHRRIRVSTFKGSEILPQNISKPRSRWERV